MRICLVSPGALTTDTGGHLYDRRMAEELRALGHDLTVVELAGRLPDPDQAAIYAARTAWSALPSDCVRLIDGSALPAFHGLPMHDVTALVHHPASMETGVVEDVLQRLSVTENEMFRDVPRLVVTSEQTADLVAKTYLIARDRIGVIIPGEDDLPRSAGSADSLCHILSVGALIPRKGHDVLLRALARLTDLDWKLTIAGSPTRDPVYAHGLYALLDELKLAQRVAIVDRASENLWRRADLFALMSRFEGYGVAIAQALRRGVPVAVTNVGAVPNLVGPEAGIVVQPDDVEQYSKAIRRMIFDDVVRRAMADLAWQSGQTLPGWTEQASRLAGVLAG